MFEQNTLKGAYFAVAAYGFWGIAPIYFKLLTRVNPLEILSHRVVWSVILLYGLLGLTGQFSTLKIGGRKLLILAGTALLLSTNWLIFIYAVVNDNIVEASLGYFINPLFSVFLGMVFLKESLRPLQWLAILIAGAGILLQLILFGEFPLLAIGLALTFGLYGLLRKNLSLPSAAGLALETTMVLPLALGFLAVQYHSDALSFGPADVSTSVLLMLGGAVTSFPLLCFAAAVTRLSLTVMGMFQYLAPSLSLMIALLVYGEPFRLAQALTFGCIWIALVLFTIESVHFHRKLRRQLAA